MKETIMKGYKALSKEGKALFGDGMGYRVGKWYKMRSNARIKSCKQGYHFFTSLADIFITFCPETIDVYEVEAKGRIVEDEFTAGKYACSEIKLVRKLDNSEIEKYIK